MINDRLTEKKDWRELFTSYTLNQATDRAHRIGQKNTVTVYRMIMKDTIEGKTCTF